MKILLSLASVVLFLLNTPAALAGSGIPSLVGTWDTKAEGALMVHGTGAGKNTHWTKNQSTMNAVIEVTSQNGRVINGVFKSPKMTEPFVAVIGFDKTLHLADGDGFLDGRIVNKNTIEIIYRHVTAKDAVVAVGVWTRRK